MDSSSGNARDDSNRAQSGAAGSPAQASGQLNQTSTSLLESIKSNDTSGWRRFAETYEPLVYRWCRRGGLAPHDAADVAQEVFIAVSEKITSFHRDQLGDSFHKWIRGITTHKVQDYWRRQQREQPSPGGTAWLVRMHEIAERCDPSSVAHTPPLDPDDPRLVAIERVRAAVKPRDWLLFERTVIDEQLPADVADEFRVSVNVVYLAKSRVLKRVKACFADADQD